ncbi:MAG TPA: PASTA domain-containing protein [Thermoanaerobaculia bacterium]|nr:PASTA domain-containing protein [Thermoanaerobaculia bacterium]
MGRRLLRWLLYLCYAGLLFAVLGLASYLSFSAFVRGGAMPVPDIVGLPLEEASAMLDRAGLRMRRVETEDRFDEKVPAEHVVQQDPSAGSAVKQGGRVRVILSRGHELVQVPDLAGQTVRAAQAQLAVSGLSLGRVARVFWTGGEPGTVALQAPLAGASVSPTASVDVVVSIEDRGSTYVMPDLVARHAEAVRRHLESRGFRFGSIKYEPYDGVEEGVILRHTPLAGYPLRRSDSITLVVATHEDG